MRTRLHNDPPGSPATLAGDQSSLYSGEKVLLTVAEAAARLGIGRTLMYELIKTGAVASVRVGRLRRIRPADLETYTAGLAVAPADQLRAAA